jgi:hypothetical protein
MVRTAFRNFVLDADGPCRLSTCMVSRSACAVKLKEIAMSDWMRDRWIQGLIDEAKESLRKWLWIHGIIDVGVTGAVSTVFGWALSMPVWIIGLLAIFVGMAVTGIVEWARREFDEPGRIKRVRRRLHGLHSFIPENNEVSMMVATTLASLHGPRDWKAETLAALRGMMRPDIVADYEEIVKVRNANEPARYFLESLEDNLTAAHLRSSPIPEHPEPSQAPAA